MAKHRIALIGASARGTYAFAKPLLRDYADTHEMVGVYDINPRRARVLNEMLNASLPTYTDLDEMLSKARPQTAIITTVDATHAQYVERLMGAGLNVVCEKPLCIDESQCRQIRAAQDRRPDLLALTAHNYRYSPAMSRIKDLLDSGIIGTIRSINFQEMLDLRHGTSYFRRWNRRKANSGGLLVHKASHCFDLMNWWVGSRAATVSATGSLSVYGPKASPFRGERCHTCEHAKKCSFYVDLTNDNFRSSMYFKAMEPGAYTPDLCVFDPEIDAEDYAAVSYRYENGVNVMFELCAYSTYEGVLINVEGSTGRIEYINRINTSSLALSAEHGTERALGTWIKLYRFEKPPEDITYQEVKGGHGGADPRMLADLLGNQPTKARASLEDGIQAVLIGAAANRSIAEGRPIAVQDLLREPVMAAR
jgi:predicted dehydrogenase